MFDDLKFIPKILTRPNEFFSRLREQSIGELYKFWLQLNVVRLVVGLLFGILSLPMKFSLSNIIMEKIGFPNLVQPLTGGLIEKGILGIILNSVIGFFISITIGFLLVIIGAFILHIFAYIFGCRGFKKTLTAVIIGSTPEMVLGPIPVIGIFAGIYSFVLEVIGLSKLHKISILRAMVIVLIPIIIMLILVVIFGLLSYLYVSSTFIGRTSKTISLLDASCSGTDIVLVISNDGTNDINTLTDIAIFVNNAKIENLSFNPIIISPHSTGITTIASYKINPGANEILIVSPSNPVKQTVYC